MKVDSILFLAEGQLGDLLLLTPTLRATRKWFPGARISLLMLERNPPDDEPLSWDALIEEGGTSPLSSDPSLDNVYTLDRTRLRSFRGWKRLKAEWTIIKFLRGLGPDVVVNSFPEDRFALWSFLSRAKIRVGENGQGFSLLLTHRPQIRRSDKGVLRYYCDLVGVLGVEVETYETSFHVNAESSVWADRVFEKQRIVGSMPVVAVHPGGRGSFKIWPPDRFAAVIRFLQNEMGVRVILLGGFLDNAIIQEVKKHLTAPPVHVDTGRNYSHLGAILRRCSLLLSNDSGPRHMAEAVGTPSISLFRLFQQQEWGIYGVSSNARILQAESMCKNCLSGKCSDLMPPGESYGSYCMHQISVEPVMALLRKMLEGEK